MEKTFFIEIALSFIVINVAFGFAVIKTSPNELTTTTELPTVSLPVHQLHQGATITQMQNSTKAVNLQSSVVNSDGSFTFIAISNGVDIQIKGSLKDVNGTQTLVLTGEYTFLNYSRSFRADESGFNVFLPFVPAHLPIKLVQTITGR